MLLLSFYYILDIISISDQENTEELLKEKLSPADE